MPETRFQGIGRNLLDWFAANARKLPWRLRYTPYEIWISEIMLQQTQVKTMLPYYHRWMKRFPCVQGVALAPEEVLLKHWEGLGYYARARNIRKTAQVLIRDFGAELPRDHDLLLSLPGIGRYTAGAIMSIAFNADCAAVDGNAVRVFSRLFDLVSPLREQQSQKTFWDIAERLLPRGRARSFNQALMDLGALVCTPKNPLCSDCPVRSWCRGLQAGVVDLRPVVRMARDIVPIHAALGILSHEGKIFIQKRPPSGLMPHLWEFPGGKLQHGETPEEALEREFHEELDLTIGGVQKFALIRHSYTTFRVTLHAFTCQLADTDRHPVLRSAVDGRWVTAGELDLYAFPAANRKLITLIQTKSSSLRGQEICVEKR
jgi:A/G-specific adenine glycosylase